MSRLPRVMGRAGQYVLVLLVATTVNFLLPHLAPGDPVTYLYGGETVGLTPEQLAEVRARYGLDQSMVEQYGAFWAGLVRSDLGVSVEYNRPVTDVLAERLPWTLALVGIATLLAFAVGTLLGAVAAWRRGTRRDAGMVVGVLVVDSMPGFWLGMLLIAVFSVELGGSRRTARWRSRQRARPGGSRWPSGSCSRSQPSPSPPSGRSSCWPGRR